MKFEIKSCRTCPCLEKHLELCRIADDLMGWQLMGDVPNDYVPSDCPLRKHEIKEVKK